MTEGGLSTTERRALQAQDARYLPLPLQSGPDPGSMAAHLRHLVRLLRDPATPSPCSDAVAHLTALYDRTVQPRADIACARGCAHCCTQPVSLSAAEAFYVAAQLRARPDAAAAVAGYVEAMRGLSQPERIARRAFCPLLEDAACSIYAARPLACHAFISVDVARCIEAFVELKEPQIPMPQDYVSVLYACRMMLMAALRIVGASDASYEMNAAVAEVLAQGPDAERRWLAGEAVLAAVEDQGAPPPQYEAAIRQMAAFVGPTV
jgi:Fe-S-cluster containining protein